VGDRIKDYLTGTSVDTDQTSTESEEELQEWNPADEEPEQTPPTDLGGLADEGERLEAPPGENDPVEKSEPPIGYFGGLVNRFFPKPDPATDSEPETELDPKEPEQSDEEPPR
jgi:hypothetical protein